MLRSAIVQAPRVCLNMIVRDESAVIERCLEAARAWVGGYLIVDTGSTDDTSAKIELAMQGLPGQVLDRPWVNFGHNRSEALQLCREQFGATFDYALVLDADDVLRLPPDWSPPALDADGYLLDVRLGDGDFVFSRVQLMRLDQPWRYVGVLHEYPHLPGCTPRALPGLEVRTYSDGARNQKGAQKYADDAAVLKAALLDEPNNARYRFYLAQCLRDAGELDAAIDAYTARAAQGGWIEERWFAHWQIASLRGRRGDSWAEVLRDHLRAWELRPTRAEPLVNLASLCRRRKDWNAGYLFARQALAIEMTDDLLFVDRSAYTWRPLDEAAIAAHYVGDFDEALRLNTALLAHPGLPEVHRPRTIDNRRFTVEAIEQRAKAQAT